MIPHTSDHPQTPPYPTTPIQDTSRHVKCHRWLVVSHLRPIPRDGGQPMMMQMPLLDNIAIPRCSSTFDHVIDDILDQAGIIELHSKLIREEKAPVVSRRAAESIIRQAGGPEFAPELVELGLSESLPENPDLGSLLQGLLEYQGVILDLPRESYLVFVDLGQFSPGILRHLLECVRQDNRTEAVDCLATVHGEGNVSQAKKWLVLRKPLHEIHAFEGEGVDGVAHIVKVRV
ncbi:hypothetical protein J3R30DRAFT_3722859 [Lentinula aciculospora]|uniref:Uncharacterized protein n=1 Tax=Lentinula aciculospora TaxID=153920 RepID=A0A9W8ZS83_9AGAR|nr:hypothetical protein J3R30DRAFT_3722859 [Lentinula aciculospora]